jgi:hypothetical protein
MASFSEIIQSQIVRHSLFWVISFTLLLLFFTRDGDIKEIDIVYTFLFHVPLIAGITIYWTGLKFFRKKGMQYAVLSACFSLLTILILYPVSFQLIGAWVFPDYFLIASYDWTEMGGIGLIYIVITSLLFIAEQWSDQQSELIKMAQLEEEAKKAELKALRSQINPHFLFNALNLIYSEAVKKSDQSPDLILKLSDILRYVLEKAEKERVSLRDEVNYIADYIDLQTARMNNPAQVVFQTAGSFDNYEIAPLLLLNFVENCFVHSDLTDRPDIRIEISTENGILNFISSNKKKKQTDQKENGVGLGIQNSKRRLDLTYPDKYSLQITDSDDRYVTQLKIELT